MKKLAGREYDDTTRSEGHWHHLGIGIKAKDVLQADCSRDNEWRRCIESTIWPAWQSIITTKTKLSKNLFKLTNTFG